MVTFNHTIGPDDYIDWTQIKRIKRKKNTHLFECYFHAGTISETPIVVDEDTLRTAFPKLPRKPLPAKPNAPQAKLEPVKLAKPVVK